MPDRSFEQQVQEELADLRIQPGTASWQVVETSLKKERKRRWLLWLLALMLCCGSSWLWWEAQKEKGNQPLKLSNQKIEIQVGKNIPVEREQKETQVKKKETEWTGIVNTGNQQKKGKETSPDHTEAPAEMEIAMNAVVKNNLERSAETVRVEAGQGNEGAVVPVTTKRMTDTLQQQAPVAAVTVPQTGKEKKSNAWKLQLFANAGSSGMRTAILKSGSQPSPLYYNIPSNNAGQSLTGAAPALHDAFSFNLGIEMIRPIGKKHSLGISIGYGLYQNWLGVGTKKDSTIKANLNGRYSNTGGYYYRNTDSMHYTNRYHFLEAVVNLYTPFKLFHSLSFRWQLGAGTSILLASNGLHYDAHDNLLFNNNMLLRKLNLQLSTGLEVGIGKYPVFYVGPQMRLFLNNLSEQPEARQYLLQSSLRAVYQIPSFRKK
jgi:hypothetical protein